MLPAERGVTFFPCTWRADFVSPNVVGALSCESKKELDEAVDERRETPLCEGVSSSLTVLSKLILLALPLTVRAKSRADCKPRPILADHTYTVSGPNIVPRNYGWTLLHYFNYVPGYLHSLFGGTGLFIFGCNSRGV